MPVNKMNLYFMAYELVLYGIGLPLSAKCLQMCVAIYNSGVRFVLRVIH